MTQRPAGIRRAMAGDLGGILRTDQLAARGDQDQRRTASEGDSPAVLWVNTTGTAMIAYRTRPGQSSHVRAGVLGVQTRTTFTPLPPATQHLIFHDGLYSRLPAW